MATWNLKDIYDFSKTDNILNDLEKKVAKFKKWREKLSEDLSEKEFLEILNQKSEMATLTAKVSSYADLWLSENTADPESNAHVVKISEQLTDLGNQTMFFSLWFKEIDDNTAEKFIQLDDGYAHMLKRIRDFKDHTLKEKEEQIINLKDLSGPDLLSRLYDVITNQFMFDWEGKQVQQPEITKFYTDSDPKKREKAYKIVLARYQKEESLLTEVYKGIVNDWRNENMKLRNYPNPINVRNKGNDIPDEAIEALLKVVKKNTKIFQDYFQLKAKILRVKKFKRFDLYAPYSAKEKEYDYETSRRIVLDTFKEFSQEAYDMAIKLFKENHIHSDLVANKRTGAFCYSIAPKITPYVLLNHTGKPRDLATMAHELGHAIHSIAANKQNIFSFHAELPLAETASVFAEQILSDRLLKDANKEQQITLRMRKMDDSYATIMRQAYFVMFENKAHEMIGKGATVDDLNKAYMQNLRNQFGKSVDVSDEFMHEWKYIPHIFHTPFYCYAYSFGNLLVLSLYKMYQNEGKEFIPKYFNILSAGSSKSPQNILSDVGIDITKESFWQQGFDVLKEEYEELKKLV